MWRIALGQYVRRISRNISYWQLEYTKNFLLSRPLIYQWLHSLSRKKMWNNYFLSLYIYIYVWFFWRPTFYQVYKRKSTEGFQSIPYAVALFSSMLLIYYALLKSNSMLLITINSVGCFIETFYIFFYIFYAPKNARVCQLIFFII